MYYITNQNDQVIAADKALLELTGLQSVEELYQKMIKEKLSFVSLVPEDLTIAFGDHEEQQYTFHRESTPLFSMLGELTLHILTASDLSAAPENKLLSLDDDISLVEKEEEPAVFSETEKQSEDEEIIPILDDELFKEAEEELTLKETPESVEEPSDFEPIALLEEEPETPFVEPSAEEEKAKTSFSEPEVKSSAPIYLDVTRISETIGITEEEYNHFLNEFIDTAISLEKDLSSDNEEVLLSAIKTLVQLSEVLYLPEISNAAKEIENASAQERERLVESFYHKLARITTQQSTLPDTELPSIEPDIIPIEEIAAAPETEIVEEPAKEELPAGSFGMIDLSDVKPIHFDFRLEEAADELSLPVELIEEFVHDFIEQARSETENMLEAYRQGNLDKIQKIGHLLKGAASNLRINPLADTLYQIQFCEDSSKLEALIKSYWAHFIAFEKQMELISK
ncbi:MAG: Hpt domain-containing protein [Sulfurovum sp.]|nr:Hpt domain-containing protein [Sulfurovum sp.]